MAYDKFDLETVPDETGKVPAEDILECGGNNGRR